MKISGNNKHITLSIFILLFAPALTHACGSTLGLYEYARENLAFLIITLIFLLLSMKFLHSGYCYSYGKLSQQNFLLEIQKISKYVILSVFLLYILQFLSPLLDNNLCLKITTDEQIYIGNLISYFSLVALFLASIVYMYVRNLRKAGIVVTYQTRIASLLLLFILLLPIPTLLTTTVFIPNTIPKYFQKELPHTKPPTSTQN